MISSASLSLEKLWLDAWRGRRLNIVDQWECKKDDTRKAHLILPKTRASPMIQMQLFNNAVLLTPLRDKYKEKKIIVKKRNQHKQWKKWEEVCAFIFYEYKAFSLGAPLPRLCFAQIAFVLCVKCYFAVKSIMLRTHGRTDTRTHRHPQLYK